ncbi:MAG: glycerol-3-phosphate 1-O-acyltransferase PlsY [Prosthecobacter sp.]|nr:glycerol-3-phosphate 1-O-acyltransferase PlsY [Prosthecobacter sp.]
MFWLTAIFFCALGGYLAGSVPFGYLAGKLKGIDIRQHGSGNIGATNAIRVLGKGIGIPVFVLDMCKGWLPVVLAKWWLARQGFGAEMVSAGAIITGFTTVLGHMFPFWLGFKGGKGVATMAGVLIGIEPLAMFGALLAWLALFFTTRYVSMASLASAVGVPATMALLMVYRGHWDWVELSLGLVVMVLVFIRHRSNISRLLAGTETRAGKKG